MENQMKLYAVYDRDNDCVTMKGEARFVFAESIAEALKQLDYCMDEDGEMSDGYDVEIHLVPTVCVKAPDDYFFPTVMEL